ncbi:hypothetical protein ABBQ32_007611 [Trebouxia sp. C0010 RCD-2024]
MYDDHMTWLAAKKANCRTTVEIWHRARKHVATLAAFHGYLPSFDWRSSEVAKYELSQLVHDHSHAQAADTNGRTVRQDRHSLSAEQLQLLYTYAMSRSAAECALLLAFCGIMGQSLARSGQICKMNRVHTSYSEANLPVTPLFGPVQLLHLGDRGHHKVNKTADMAHWVMRTMRPSLACPWFGQALKTALDAKQQQGVQYEELLSQCTGELVLLIACLGMHACMNMVTIFYIVCSAGDRAMTEHVRKAKFVDKVKYRMAPLLSASVLLETDPREKQAGPFRRVTTEDMIDIIAKGLRYLGIAHQKRGKKTNLIRDSFIALLTLLGGEQILHFCFHHA